MPVDTSSPTRSVTGPGSAAVPIEQPVEPAPEVPAVASPDPLVGVVIAERYRLIERVGEGGMGAVYLAEHVALRKRVAVKFLHAELSRIPEVVARFEREAIAAADLDHPNVVAAHDFGKSADGVFFLVMEFVEGGTLRTLLDQEKRLPPVRAMHIARHIAAALTRAHARGIVHRDLKPDNVVMVERDGDRDFAKVIDFGIAKVAPGRLGNGAAPLTQAGMVFGTPDYMAPEQALGGKVDHRADLYAFGVMVFEMLSGRRPFESDDVMILLGQHMTSPPPAASSLAPPGALPPAVDPILSRMLAKPAGERYENALDFVRALENALGIASPVGSGTYPPGILAPIPSSIGTPAFGLPAVAPSAVTGLDMSRTSATSAPPVARPSHASPVAAALAIARRQLESALEHGPRRIAVGIALGAAAILSLAVAFATRPTPALIPLTPITPLVPVLSSAPRTTIVAATQPPHVAPTATAPTNSATPTVAPAMRPAAAVAPGLPAALAARLDAYESQPSVHALLAASRAGQRDAVIAAFESTREQSPNDAIVNYLLGSLYAHQRNGAANELDRYTDALRIEPGFAQDPALVRDVVNVYVAGHDESAAASQLISGTLAATAADQLLDVAFDTHITAERTRAAALLASPALSASMTPTVRALAALVSAHTCEQKLDPIQQLATNGDARALPYLRRIPTDNGCGRWWRSARCNPCLGTVLPAAIRAIEARTNGS